MKSKQKKQNPKFSGYICLNDTNDTWGWLLQVCTHMWTNQSLLWGLLRENCALSYILLKGPSTLIFHHPPPLSRLFISFLSPESLSVSPPLVSTANVTHTVKSEFSWLPVYTGDNGFRKKQQLIDLTPLDICLKMMELNVIFFHLNYDTNTVSDVCWRMQMSKSGEICMCKSNCYRQSWICACKMWNWQSLLWRQRTTWLDLALETDAESCNIKTVMKYHQESRAPLWFFIASVSLVPFGTKCDTLEAGICDYLLPPCPVWASRWLWKREFLNAK